MTSNFHPAPSLRMSFRRLSRDWRRPHFVPWYAQKQPEAMMAEEDMISAIMELAQKSTSARVALDWARRHHIVIAVDRDRPRNSCYVVDAGVALLSIGSASGSFGMPQAVTSLTHELRHAWQDYYGLIPHCSGPQLAFSGLAHHLVQEAFFEADAYAHGRLAQQELKEPAMDVTRARKLLRGYFVQWHRRHGASYATRTVNYYAQIWGLVTPPMPIVGAVASAKCHTMRILPAKAPRLGIDPSNRADIDLLGRSFASGNYLAGFRWQSLPLFNSQDVLAFYLGEKPESKPLVEKILSKEKAWRHHYVPLPVRPLPK